MPSVNRFAHWNTAFYQRWEEVFRWLGGRVPAFSALQEVSVSPELLDFCPIHGGDSGEAFHVYPDFRETGGCVCNTCGSFNSGMSFLHRLAEDRGISFRELKTILQEFSEETGLSVPGHHLEVAVQAWIRACDPEIALRYLTNRGIPGLREETLPAALRGIREDAEDSRPSPQVRALFVDVHGTPNRVQRILLSPDGSEKNPDFDNAKILFSVDTRSPKGSFHCELSYPEDEDSSVVGVGEGIETMLAVRAAQGPGMRYWALGAIGGQYAGLVVPEGVSEIHIYADKDRTLGSAKTAATLLAEQGLTVFLHVPPEGAGKDWLDVLVEKGVEETRAFLAENEELSEPRGRELSVPAGRREDSEETPSSERFSEEDSINLDIPDGELFQKLDALFPLFCRESWFGFLYPTKTVPVKLEDLAVSELEPDDIAAAISEKVSFFQVTRDSIRYQPAPKARIASWWISAIARDIVLRHLRPLAGVLQRPSVVQYAKITEEHPEGEECYLFQHEAGYNEETMYYLVLNPLDAKAIEDAEIHLGSLENTQDTAEQPLLLGDWKRREEEFSVSDEVYLSPVHQKIRHLVQETLQRILVDFHFASIADSMNTVALLTSPLFVPACDNVPMTLIQAPARGAGKTTLAHIFCQLWGSFLQIAVPDDEAEMEKRLGTAFSQAKNILLLDNLNRLESPALTNLLTSAKSYETRKLGSNESIPMPPEFQVIGTGNNPIVQHELARRVQFIDLDPPRDIVTEEVGFCFPDIVGWISELHNRLEIRRVLYLALLAWEKTGFPLLGTGELPDGGFFPKLESFQTYAKLTQTFQALYLPGNLYQYTFTNQRKYLDADSESDEIVQFVSGWIQEAGNMTSCEGEEGRGWFPVSSLHMLAERLGVPSSILEFRRTSSGQTQRMGMWLGRLSGRRFEINGQSWRIVRHPSMLWFRQDDDVRKRTRAYKLEQC